MSRTIYRYVLLDGQDLKELIKSGSPLTVEQILGIMEQIAEGLGPTPFTAPHPPNPTEGSAL